MDIALGHGLSILHQVAAKSNEIMNKWAINFQKEHHRIYIIPLNLETRTQR